MNTKQTFIRCRCVHFPEIAATPHTAQIAYLDDAILHIQAGKVVDLQPAETFIEQGLDLSAVDDIRPKLVMPGFIDSHVHAPQVSIIGAYGKQLLEWLDQYTFPAEIKYADIDYAQSKSKEFIENLLAYGTTTAFVYGSSHKHSIDCLFSAAHAINMRLVAGKVLMDRNAPEALLDPIHGIKDTQTLLEDWHNKGRLGYALTPRFAGTSTRTQLQAAGELLKQFPDIWLQTHLSENTSEIAWTQQLFPESKDYLDVYESFGLHTEKTIFGHCIHLSESEHERIASTGSTVAFCPSSNLFLGSGLLNLNTLHNRNISYALATDIGAGTSLSMFQTMGDAYKVSQLQGYSLSASEAYYACTLGSAVALQQDSYIGNFNSGKEADFIIIDSQHHPFLDKRLSSTNSIEEELFIYMTLADDRIIDATYIAGEKQYQQRHSNRAAV